MVDIRNAGDGQAPNAGSVRSRPGSLPGLEAPSLVELMRMSYEEGDAWTRGSAIRRAGCAGFRRNVAVALGTWLASVEEPPEEAAAVPRDAYGDENELVITRRGRWPECLEVTITRRAVSLRTILAEFLADSDGKSNGAPRVGRVRVE
jgi:hypothetical protein